MARARNIKPSFFQNEELGELQPIERLAFIGMWTIADFKGCIEFRPKRLKIQLMPYDNCDMELIAINLDKSGLIRLYSVGGIRYIKIINFEKHQNPHKNERDAGSEIPDYCENNIEINNLKNIEIYPDKNGTAHADSLFLNPDSLIPITETLNRNPEKNIVPQSETLEVFNYWKLKLNHANAKLDKKREKTIKERLKDGYTVEQICKAIDGCSIDPFSMGQNDRKTIYDDIELICRSATKLDSFILIQERGKQSNLSVNTQKTLNNLQAYAERHGIKL